MRKVRLFANFQRLLPTVNALSPRLVTHQESTTVIDSPRTVVSRIHLLLARESKSLLNFRENASHVCGPCTIEMKSCSLAPCCESEFRAI